MGKSSGLSQQTQNEMAANNTALVNIAKQQAGQSSQLFNAAYPGFNQAENFYGSLSTGDPYAISRAISPAAQQIGAATAGAKANIMNNLPAGGEKMLALENADVNQGAQVGHLASGAYLNSYNALASLAGQGVGESTNLSGAATYGYGQANQGAGQLGNLQVQQKGAQLGALTGLGKDVASLPWKF